MSDKVGTSHVLYWMQCSFLLGQVADWTIGVILDEKLADRRVGLIEHLINIADVGVNF